MEDTIDPWDWDTQRLVQELCTDQRTWTPTTNPPKLPDLDRLKASLQYNEVDGQCFLGSASDESDFWSDLGIKAIKHKDALRTARNQFRRRSRKYKIWKLRQDQEDDDADAYIDRAEQFIEASEKRKLEEERKDDSGESTYNTPRVVLSEPSTPAAPQRASTPAASTPVAPPTPKAKPGDISPSSEEPARKKRRIAPITLSADAAANSLRNIPRGNLVSELKPSAEGTNVELLGAYLGPDVLNRADIIEFDFSTQPLANTDLEFESHKEPYPIGMRRQRARLVKRQFTKWKRVFRPAKADMVPGGDDPEHYEVLPAYGESDDEYDSDTWKEVQEEEEERKKLKEKPRKDLSPDEKTSMVDRIIAEKVAAWQKDKLPVLEQKANRIWNGARRQGLKHALARENKFSSRYQERLDNYRGEIINQQWSNEADMRKVEGVLDQTITDLQHSSWVLNLLRSPIEPKKLPKAPRPLEPKLPHIEQAPASDEEILTSESESDDTELRDFIVDDDLEIRDEVMVEAGYEDAAAGTETAQHQPESTEVTSAKNQDARDVGNLRDVPTNDADFPINEDSDSASIQQKSPPSAKQNLSSIQIVDHQNPSMAINRDHDAEHMPMDSGDVMSDQEETLDLTQVGTPIKHEETPTSKPKLSLKCSLKTPAGSEVIDLVTPEKGKAVARTLFTSSPQLSWVAARSLGPSGDKLSENEKAVYDLIQNLDEIHRSAVFSLAQWKVDNIWKGFVLPALTSESLPRFPYSSEQEKDTFYALHLARLFTVFLGGNPQHLRRWFASKDDRAALEDNSDQFRSFVLHLRKLSLCYRPKSVSREPPTPSAPTAGETSAKASDGTDLDHDGDLDVVDSDDESSPRDKNRKPLVIKRDQAAMSLRESDVRRVEEQAERRQALRAKLALLQDTAASQKMRLIINESKEEREGFIYVPQNIADHIKDHQISGVRFMWNQVVMNAKARQGCLLAHTMGLGKTMQIITLLMAIADAAMSDDPSVSSQIPDDLKQSKTLVLAPSGLVNNWDDEFFIWTEGAAHHLGKIMKIDSTYKDHMREEILEDWTTTGGVLLIGYDLFRNLVTKSSIVKAQLLETPNIIVADEAHQLKNTKSQIHQITAEFRSNIRIALTGSPLANNVQEYYAMINWIAANYLGDPAEFRQVFANPIESGISVDSSRYERRKALVKLQSLKATVAPKVHRRTIHALKDELPQKTEFVISVPLTELQRNAYELYMNYHYGESETARLFATLNVLGLLCNHPACFRERIKKQSNSQKSGDELTRDAALPAQFVSQALTLIRQNDVTGSKGEGHSWKIPLFNSILDECSQQGDKVLVFSQSIPTLDYLESVLRRRKRSFIRLDGSTMIHKRQDMVKDFNKSAYDVFLLSTTAGGYGLNIIGANRVIIFDFKFNPQHEQQAVGRAYRLGQTKPVFVYRFICGGTFEEKMQNKGVFKMQLASRVVDKKNPIPRGQRFEEFFAKPVEPEQRDLSLCTGKDKVLDAVLRSEVAQCIRSIVMADTFEEENLEDEQLTSEEKLEAKQLIDMHQARLTGKPFAAIPLPPGGGRRPSPPIVSSSAAVTAAVNGALAHGWHALPSVGTFPTTVISGASSIGVTSRPAFFTGVTSGPAFPSVGSSRTASSTADPMVANNLEGAPHPSFQSGTVEPVLGPTTQVRGAPLQTTGIMPDSALKFWENTKLLKSELGRIFTQNKADVATKDEMKEIAQQIANAVNRQTGLKDRQQLAQMKLALVESAENSSRFVEAMLTGRYSPAYLASLTAAAIRELISQKVPETTLTAGTSSAQFSVQPSGPIDYKADQAARGLTSGQPQTASGVANLVEPEEKHS